MPQSKWGIGRNAGFGIDEIQAEYVAEIKLRHLNREYILKRLNEIEDLEDELATKNSIISLNNTTITGLESQIEELEETQNSLLESIDSLEQDKKYLLNALEQREAEVAAANSRIVELNTEITNKQTAIQTLEEQKQSLQTELSEKKTENAELNAEIAALTTTVQEKEEGQGREEGRCQGNKEGFLLRCG